MDSVPNSNLNPFGLGGEFRRLSASNASGFPLSSVFGSIINKKSCTFKALTGMTKLPYNQIKKSVDSLVQFGLVEIDDLDFVRPLGDSQRTYNMNSALENSAQNLLAIDKKRICAETAIAQVFEDLSKIGANFTYYPYDGAGFYDGMSSWYPDKKIRPPQATLQSIAKDDSETLLYYLQDGLQRSCYQELGLNMDSDFVIQHYNSKGPNDIVFLKIMSEQGLEGIIQIDRRIKNEYEIAPECLFEFDSPEIQEQLSQSIFNWVGVLGRALSARYLKETASSTLIELGDYTLEIITDPSQSLYFGGGHSERLKNKVISDATRCAFEIYPHKERELLEKLFSQNIMYEHLVAVDTTIFLRKKGKAGEGNKIVGFASARLQESEHKKNVCHLTGTMFQKEVRGQKLMEQLNLELLLRGLAKCFGLQGFSLDPMRVFFTTQNPLVLAAGFTYLNSSRSDIRVGGMAERDKEKMEKFAEERQRVTSDILGLKASPEGKIAQFYVDSYLDMGVDELEAKKSKLNETILKMERKLIGKEAAEKERMDKNLIELRLYQKALEMCLEIIAEDPRNVYAYLGEFPLSRLVREGNEFIRNYQGPLRGMIDNFITTFKLKFSEE